MSRQSVPSFLGMFSFLALVASFAGCGRGPGASDQQEKEHIRHVVSLAQDYESATKKKARSLDDVKNWAIKEGKASEADFISPRDQQPYGLSSGMMGVLVYEQTGKNGKCFLYSTGAVREVEQGEVETMKKLEKGRRGGSSR